MRDREQAIKAVTQAMFEPQAYWEEPVEAGEVAERVIDVYEALPVVITDEMVWRAAEACWPWFRNRKSPPEPGVMFRGLMMTALDAALNPGRDDASSEAAEAEASDQR